MGIYLQQWRDEARRPFFLPEMAARVFRIRFTGQISRL
jgi:hypothetical protein